MLKSFAEASKGLLFSAYYHEMLADINNAWMRASFKVDFLPVLPSFWIIPKSLFISFWWRVASPWRLTISKLVH
ncbi:MAG: hypothetical protein QXR45_16525, partial [Candidatus Bathyarchaeia archaeon]